MALKQALNAPAAAGNANNPNVMSAISVPKRAADDLLKIEFYVKKRKVLLKDLSTQVKKFVQAREKEYLEELDFLTRRYMKRRNASRRKVRARKNYHK